MKSTYFIVLAVISLLLVSACESKDKTGIPSITPFTGGANALTANFLPGAPPDFILDAGNSPFGIAVQIENKGEADVEIEDAFVEVKGINPIDFGLPNQAALVRPLPARLEASRKNFDGTVIPGGQTIVEFGELNYIPNIFGNTQIKIRANLCYRYTTSVSSKICVKRNILEIRDQPEICNVNEDKVVFSSGGPIHVTKLREAPVGENKIQFIFEIANVGDPNAAFFKVTSDDCEDVITNIDRYKVFLSATSDINGVKPVCSGLEDPTPDRSAGFVNLFDGNPRTVTCTLDVSTVESDFEDLITFDLEYRYLQSIEKLVEIRDVTTS